MPAGFAIPTGVTADLVALGRRIRDLRGSRSAADLARRAGIKPAYLHAIEHATPSGRGRPARPSVPVLRAIADALGASRAELLSLAGHEDDAAYDQVQEMRAARQPEPVEPLDAIAQRVAAIEAQLAEQGVLIAKVLEAVTASDRRLRDLGT